MAASPIQVIVGAAVPSSADLRRAQADAPAGSEFSRLGERAKKLAEIRMQQRGAALGNLAAELTSKATPAVRVRSVRLEQVPRGWLAGVMGEASGPPAQRWLIEFSGAHLPGGFSSVPVSLELEQECARHVLDTLDELQRQLLRGVEYPRSKS